MDEETSWKPPRPFKSLNEFEYYLDRYLHKRDIEPIFDVTRWSYYRPSRIESSDFNGRSLRLKASTTSGGPFLRVELSFICENAVLVRINEDRPMNYETRKVKLEKRNGSLILDSERARVEVHSEPWNLRFLDKNDRVLLEEYGEGLKRTYFPVFPLSFKKAGEDLHLVESFGLEPDEAIYGFGEKFTPLDKRGQAILLWNSDATLTGGDRSYKCIPFYASTRNYGVFVNFGGKIVFEVGSGYSSTSLSFEAWSPKLEYIVILGSSLKEVISTYMGITGRPRLPPLWSFGFWQSRAEYKSREQVMNVARELRRRRIPCDVIHIDPSWLRPHHYCDLEWNTDAFPNPREMLKELSDMGFKVSLWMQPYIPKETELYREAVERGYLLKKKNGEAVDIVDFVHSSCGIVDFTHPQAREWYKAILKRRMEEGVRVFKADMGEAIPEEAAFYDGRTGLEAHNAYAVEYSSTVFEAVRDFYGEGLVWGRPGYAGIQAYPAQWAGDSHSTYKHMAATLWGVLSYSMSGVPFWSHDIGGFQGDRPTPELYVRWAQWGLLGPLSRAHGSPPREPWEYGEEALKIFKKFDELRYSLIPYLCSLAVRSCDDCVPMVRPMVLEFQNDPTTWRIDSQYMLGKGLMVIPVLSEGGEVSYYLPGGWWADFWRPRKELSGRVWIRQKVSLSSIPLWIREDAIIPITEPVQYVGEKPFREITAMIYPKNRGTFRYSFDGEACSISFTKSKGNLEVTLGPSKKTWNVKLMNVVKPKRVTGAKWSYGQGSLTLEGITPERRTRIRVSL